jgi:lipoprotein-anchoring transpeptidase ErfK/SrfK
MWKVEGKSKMGKSKNFVVGITLLFGVIGTIGYLKKKELPKEASETIVATLLPTIQEVKIAEPIVQKVILPPKPTLKEPAQAVATSPELDRVPLLFTLDSSKLPFVETISYTSRVPWLKGRAAWISDYASYYETSRHFIARSLNKKADYFSQKVGPGDRFNVFKKDKNIRFHLLVDLEENKMRFYCIDQDAGERMLLKTYKVGSGRSDAQKKSGYLTPVGKYELGSRIAVYKPGTMGLFKEQKTEMIRVFGTRWIPFAKELEGCSEPAKGFGIHGAPWTLDSATGQIVEDLSVIQKHDSDGCLRLAKEDIEELFAIIVSKPTTVEIVQHFADTTLPGVEK